jgi:streptogramin lyase
MPTTARRFRILCLYVTFAGGFALVSIASAAVAVSGQVVDLNGNPVAQAQVIFDRDETGRGASVVTVFSGGDGKFSFPGVYPEADGGDSLPITVRALGYETLDTIAKATAHRSGLDSVDLTIVVGATGNQIAVAPASAWLGRITDRREQSQFIMDCIDCHQVPASEVRNYAGLIADQHAANPERARSDSWNAIVKYMNYLSTWEFSRGQRSDDEQIDADAVYSVANEDRTAALLARVFDDRLDSISGFDWGAPLIANQDTVIWEYEVPHPNAVREALLLGSPAELWIADVASNNMIAVDVATGEQTIHTVPSEVLMSPHSLHRGQDGSLWITPLFNSIVAHLDVNTGQWKTWRLKTPQGQSPGIHDLSFGWEHELLEDDEGRIWFSDIGNTAVGYFDPESGKAENWAAPPSPGRPGRAMLYGLIMNRDKTEVWYSQLANGTIGGFDIEKKEFIGPFQLDDPNAGPRRITISDDDIMYAALYGSGQLLEFDTRARKVLGVYDMPDTASAPYSATWDPVRKIVWVATANGDVIYRFDPRTKAIGILPMPREQAFMRMIDIDPRTGVLVSSYANIVDIVQGPRMAMIIDPGDNAYPETFTLATQMGN